MAYTTAPYSIDLREYTRKCVKLWKKYWNICHPTKTASRGGNLVQLVFSYVTLCLPLPPSKTISSLKTDMVQFYWVFFRTVSHQMYLLHPLYEGSPLVGECLEIGNFLSEDVNHRKCTGWNLSNISLHLQRIWKIALLHCFNKANSFEPCPSNFTQFVHIG